MEGYFAFSPQKDMIGNLLSEKGKCKVCCFSPSYANMLLWSHYADSHKGVCLEYEIDIDKLPEFVYYVEVKYGSEIPEFELSLSGKEQAIHCLSHKLNPWKYEKERRLISYDAVQDNMRTGRFVGITFGCRFNEFYCNQLQHETDNRDIFERLISYEELHHDFLFYEVNNITVKGRIERCEIVRLRTYFTRH